MLPFLGVIGAAIIVIGWGVALKAPPPPLRLSMLYSIGSFLLTVYAVSINDIIFTFLNAFATLLGVINALRASTFKKCRR